METFKFLLKYIVWGFVLAISATITGVLVVKAWNGLLADSWDTLSADKWNELVSKVDGVNATWWNVWIGTSIPNAKLHVKADAPNGILLEVPESTYSSLVFITKLTDPWNWLTWKWRKLWINGNLASSPNKLTLQFMDNWIVSDKASITPDGKVGIGTSTPINKLDVAYYWPDFVSFIHNDSSAGDWLKVQAWPGVGWDKIVIGGFDGGWFEIFRVQSDGRVGIGTSTPAGMLDVNWSIFQRGGSLHADYVFEPEYVLETIEEHTEFMWENKHLKAVPKGVKDDEWQDIVEWGARNKGVLEELEKAHVYIDQLNNEIKDIKAENTILKWAVCLDHPELTVCE